MPACQGGEKERVDQLIDSAYKSLKVLEIDQVINTAFEIVRLSEKADYEGGIVTGYLLILDILAKSGEYEKCMDYIEKIKPYEEGYFEENMAADFSYHILQSEIYHFLGMPTQSAVYFKKAEQIIQREKDSQKRQEYLYFLSTVAHFYSHDPDTIYQYLLKAKAIVSQPDFKENGEKERVIDQALVELLIGNYFLEKGFPDSAMMSYHTSEAYSLSAGGHYMDGGIYNGLGSAYGEKGQGREAAVNYRKALDIFKRFNSQEDIRQVYSNMSELYHMQGDADKSNEYKALAARISESLEEKKAKGRDRNTLLLINEKEEAVRQTELKHRRRGVMLSAAGGMVLLLTGIYFYSDKKRKNKLIREKERQLSLNRKALEKKSEEAELLLEEIEKTSKEIEKKELEKQALASQVNESFEEVIRMAKENDPLFWKRFQEVYPGFLGKMLSSNQDFRTSELILCAYIYLGFSSKEFAEYTFKSAKTVENYRYTIRKRLGLQPEEDLRLWIQSFIDSRPIVI